MRKFLTGFGFFVLLPVSAVAQNCPVEDDDLHDIADRARVMASIAEAAVEDSVIYRRYFGPPGDQDLAQLSSTYAAISSHLLIGIVNYECNSPATSCDQGDFAYVFNDEPYTLYICPDFFSLPQHTDIPVPPATIDDRWGGQEGTIIHEMSHFENVASTVDKHKGRKIYGRSECEQLAEDVPGSTLKIADCVQYFAEDVTAPILLDGL
ncbi:M35 family metallo-endopeptidase [uncultured Sulfitobacter sp.]|uniref:M35 family metallo-endopeptidase n=1 Tax=uncultured Sulfitobacter sp. TaxID=191468 RepID=UPI0026151ABF|nr:M35 family metallo-endopeptidase [uncultured Sulfitobacter sp.]